MVWSVSIKGGIGFDKFNIFIFCLLVNEFLDILEIFFKNLTLAIFK